MLLSMAVLAVVGRAALPILLLLRLISIPVVAGLSFEVHHAQTDPRTAGGCDSLPPRRTAH